MPTYEYACTNGHRFDVVQSFSEAPLTECRECGASVRRVFHPVGIVLKGSGFYSTDNRGGKKFTPASEKGGSEKGGSEKGGSDTGGSDKNATSPGSSSSDGGSTSSGSGSSDKKSSGSKSESA